MRNKRGKLDYISFICGTDMNNVCAMNNIIRISEVSLGYYNCRNCVSVDTISRNVDCPLIRKGVLRGLI
jgi:hypothetical protein